LLKEFGRKPIIPSKILVVILVICFNQHNKHKSQIVFTTLDQVQLGNCQNTLYQSLLNVFRIHILQNQLQAF
jgi:hypothetical protein